MPEPPRNLAQFFTPAPVVRLAYDAMQWLAGPIGEVTIADPACGAGEWLREGLARCRSAHLVGCDRDRRMARLWREAGLADDRRCELLVADALLPATLRGRAFDLVVGNPPFGITLADAGVRRLREVARLCHLHRGAGAPRQPAARPSAADLQRLRRFPLELVFLERFLGLCRPGGRVAIILPEGVAANARWRYVRRWLLERVTMELVVSLPRETFRAHATTAKTCLMLMQSSPPPAGHQVLLAALPESTIAACGELLERLRSGRIEAANAPLPDGLLPPPALARGRRERAGPVCTRGPDAGA